MALDLVLQLKNGADLKAVATEVKALNAYVGHLGLNPATGEDWFPRPFKCNPDSTSVEGFVGDVNTPPDVQGYFNVRINDYTYINWGMLPQQPQTFNIVTGKPETTGIFA